MSLRTGLGTGARSDDYHPRRRRVLVGVKRASSIIHAEGVRVGVPSARAKGARGGLPIAGDPFELAAYVLEVLRADAQAKHFFDHGREVGQRANNAQWRGGGGGGGARGRRARTPGVRPPSPPP